MAEKNKGAQRELLSDEEIHQRIMSDPEVQARIQTALAKVRSGKREGPGLTAEELPEFLREHG